MLAVRAIVCANLAYRSQLSAIYAKGICVICPCFYINGCATVQRVALK
jgi:hypothetical protein